MAYATPSICACGYIKQYGEKCPRCSKSSDKEYNNLRRNQSVQDEVYQTKRWREIRKIALNRDKGLCIWCFKENRIEPAVIVDHIVEIKDGGAKWDLENLQCLCRSCHNKKTFGES